MRWAAALGLGIAAGAAVWMLRGRGPARPGLPPGAIEDWAATRAAALAWTPPPPGLAGEPWTAPDNAATVGDVMGLFDKGGPLSGLLSRLFGVGGEADGPAPAPPPAEVAPPVVTRASYTPAGAPDGGIRDLLDLIGSVEGPRGYDDFYRGITTPPPRPLTQMTVAEVLAWQDRAVRAGARSSAAGRYQILRGTLRDLVAQGVLSPGEMFGPDAQDRAAVALMRRRGLDRYQAGTMSQEDFARALAQEWAALPDPRTGRSYYGGDGLNRALVGVRDVLAAIGRIGRGV